MLTIEWEDVRPQPAIESLLSRVAEIAWQEERLAHPIEVTVLLTTDARLHVLNRDFRGVDKPTDVLAFAQREGEEPFVASPRGIEYLGDIAISLPRAEQQARAYGHSLERELGYLFIHGLLHLLGYDHDTEAHYRAMREREEAILRAAGLPQEPAASTPLDESAKEGLSL